MIYEPIRTRKGVMYGGKATQYQAEIVPGKSIRIVTDQMTGYDGKPIYTHFDKTFKVGDTAEYDSYNLSYFDRIEKITETQVWIHDHTYNKTKRLSIWEFAWRNYDFNLAKKKRDNSDDLQYI